MRDRSVVMTLWKRGVLFDLEGSPIVRRRLGLWWPPFAVGHGELTAAAVEVWRKFWAAELETLSGAQFLFMFREKGLPRFLHGETLTLRRVAAAAPPANAILDDALQKIQGRAQHAIFRHASHRDLIKFETGMQCG